MIRIKEIISKFLKKEVDNDPWLAYYSKEDKSIKFTDKSIFDYLQESVGTHTDYYALNYFGTRITFQELFKKVEIVARALTSLGVKKSDIVTICMPNTPEAIITFYACSKIGAVADMIHPLAAANEIKLNLDQSKSRILILYDANYEKMKDLLDDTNVYKTILLSVKESMPVLTTLGYEVTKGFRIKKPKHSDHDYISWTEFISLGYSYRKDKKIKFDKKDLAVILHSGGTTGRSKGVMISSFNFNALAQQASVIVNNVRPKDKIMTILPIFHGFGIGVCVHAPLCLRMEVILIPEFDGKRFPNTIKKYNPNVIAGVPTLWEAMLGNKNFDDVDLSPLKYVISGGDFLTVGMEEKMNTFLRTRGASISITKGYGMTESVAATAYTFEGTNEPGAIGIPLVGNDFCICKPGTTEELPLGEEGEICVSGPTLMMGYYNNKEETEKTLIKHKDGKVYLHSGDLGYISPNGIIYFTQRLKRMIISSGFNLYPSQIEEVLESHESVKKSCVIGIPHPYKIQVAKAFVVLKNKNEKESKIRNELKKLCKENLAAYSQPKEIEFRDDLPKTLYNKIDYRTLEKEEYEKNGKEKSN